MFHHVSSLPKGGSTNLTFRVFRLTTPNPKEHPMTTTEPLPAAVAELIRRGNDEAARKRREVARAAAELASQLDLAAAEMLAEVRAAVVAAGIGLTEELAEYLMIEHGTPWSLKANGYATATLRLPGCSRVNFNVSRKAGGFQIGNPGEASPFFARVAGHGAAEARHDTLGMAVASAREAWVSENVTATA